MLFNFSIPPKKVSCEIGKLKQRDIFRICKVRDVNDMFESALLFGSLVIRVGPRRRSEYELFEVFLLPILIIEDENCVALGFFNFLESALCCQDDVSTH